MSHARGQDGETGDGIKLFTDEKNANALRGLLNGEPTLAGYLTAHLSRLDAGDYFALLAYIEMNDAHERALQAMRVAVRARRVATCVEFGPRNVVRRERRLGRAGASFWIDVAIVAEIISFAFAAHLVEIALGTVVQDLRGISRLWDRIRPLSPQLHDPGLRRCDPSWRLLGPLEAANGMRMFGVSTP